ncbi:thiaminase (transcriptional activator TenA) [Asanoa hainanensis]|uniref:Thiaminase (Transcriptional activator TenA) n=1 Tax=Asanoa hainanensis TaxID=560556 RepID=A0A239PA74_9ACTN|nr:TenA family protein [Asanoa hainanensis]SNT63970.1 thiaminase (transcriptional activator TenA) [Asanoa hainanensis]
MSLAATLWHDNADLAEAALAHPFVQRLGDGTLPQPVFAGYVAQDAFYLESFARAYALAVAHSPDRAGFDAFADLLAGVRDELRLHEGYAARYDIDLASVEPLPATLAYTDFLLATAALGSLGQTCAALTPCMRLYAHLGQSLAAGTPADRYGDWIRTYADPGFEELAATLERLLDTYAVPGDARTAAVYRRAMRLEVGFFEAAYTS